MTQKKARTWKQRALVVISVLMILFAILAILLGMLLAVLSGSSEFAQSMQGALADSALNLFATALTGGQLTMLLAAICFATGFFDLLCGIFGIRGFRDAAKVRPYLVMACLSFAVNIVQDVLTAVNGTFEFSLGWVTGLAFSLFSIWLGWSILEQSHHAHEGLGEGEGL